MPINKKTLGDIGEKKLIADYIVPLINPNTDLTLAGDDCAVINVGENRSVCVSTDRVPSDLVSFKLGIINYYELGYYTAILNISDILSSGAKPLGILLNLAFPAHFCIRNFEDIMTGAKAACEVYGCSVIGGDLSDSSDMNLVATSIGVANSDELLYRRGCQNEDLVYCSDYIGLTSTAFSYLKEAKNKGFQLSTEEESVLFSVFRYPTLRSDLSCKLAKLKTKYAITCMDNTDGVYQSLYEICLSNSVGMVLDAKCLPIHPISYRIANFLNIDIYNLIFSAGADFRLIGTIASKINTYDLSALEDEGLKIIGTVSSKLSSGQIKLNTGDDLREIKASGWNYYGENE